MEKSHQKESKQQAKKRKQQEKQAKNQQKGKKNRQKQSQSSSEQSDEDIDLNQIEHLQGEEAEQEEVNFLVAEINQQYYHSFKTILLRLSQITKTTNSELADAVIQSKDIGNVVLADDEQDDQQDEQDEQELEDDQQNAYAVVTILSGKNKLAKNIKKVISKSAESKGQTSQVQSLINNETTHIIINQRLANLPAFIANSYQEVFKKDMMELKQKDRKKYDQYFSGYLLNVSEIQYEGSEDLDKLVYSKFQDFQMCQRAKAWWLGQRNNTLKKKADMRNLYYLIKAEEYFKGVDKIKTYLDE